jgi:hypothetical protein
MVAHLHACAVVRVLAVTTGDEEPKERAKAKIRDTESEKMKDLELWHPMLTSFKQQAQQASLRMTGRDRGDIRLRLLRRPLPLETVSLHCQKRRRLGSRATQHASLMYHSERFHVYNVLDHTLTELLRKGKTSLASRAHTLEASGRQLTS